MEDPVRHLDSDWITIARAAGPLFVSRARSNRAASQSLYHGFRHWRGVAAVSLRLSSLIEDADRAVIVMFAMFHDIERWDDGSDLGHGERSAQLVESAEFKAVGLTPDQVRSLAYACRYHTSGLVSENPTIGACWDADRLTLWRVGIVPVRRFLSTNAAKSDAMLSLGRTVVEAPPRWRELLKPQSG